MQTTDAIVAVKQRMCVLSDAVAENNARWEKQMQPTHKKTLLKLAAADAKCEEVIRKAKEARQKVRDACAASEAPIEAALRESNAVAKTRARADIRAICAQVPLVCNKCDLNRHCPAAGSF
jgi:hypothetical protein